MLLNQAKAICVFLGTDDKDRPIGSIRLVPLEDTMGLEYTVEADDHKGNVYVITGDSSLDDLWQTKAYCTSQRATLAYQEAYSKPAKSRGSASKSQAKRIAIQKKAAGKETASKKTAGKKTAESKKPTANKRAGKTPVLINTKAATKGRKKPGPAPGTVYKPRRPQAEIDAEKAARAQRRKVRTAEKAFLHLPAAKTA